MQYAAAIVLIVVFWVLGYKRAGVALVLAPFAIVFIMLCGCQAEDAGLFSLGLVLFLGTLIAIRLAPRDPGAESWPRYAARMILIVLGILVATVVIGVLFGAWAILGVFFLILFVVCTIVRGFYARRTKAMVVFSTLCACMRQNLPLPMALDSAAMGRSDGTGQVLGRISRWLVQGYSLSEAIKRGYPMCPAHALGMVIAAERMDQLPATLQIIERDLNARAASRSHVNPVYPFYPVVLMIFIMLHVTALSKFVIPRVQEVVMAMTGGQLPPATRLLLRVSDGSDWLWLVLIASGLVFAGIAIRVRLRPRRPDTLPLFSRVGDYLKWHLPLSRWFERNRSLIQTVEVLRLSLTAGSPVDRAIADTLTLDTNACFRRRLRRWHRAVEQGQDAADAAIRNRLGSALAWAFDTKVNQGNTPAVLEMLGSFYRANYSYRVNLARFILWPGLTLAMGLVVGFVVYAVFSPGVAILQSMTQIYP